MQVVLAVLGCVSVIAAAPKTASVTEYLERVSDYASSLDLPSNSLNNKSGVSMDGVGGTDHIFVNGNLARVLISTWKIQPAGAKNETYLRQGLEWCDTLCSLQATITSSAGNPAGYWGVGYGGPKNCAAPLRGACAHGGDIYFGDTGTAVTALAVCYNAASALASATNEGNVGPEGGAGGAGGRPAAYLAAMERYATFVLEGSSTAPTNKKGSVPTFVNVDGSVGCGYYAATNRTNEACSAVKGPAGLNCPSVHPYTIATGTTGAAFFSELYAITKNASYAAVAAAAINYEASVVLGNGEVPYILDGANCSTVSSDGCHAVGGPWPFDTISYVTEGVAGASLLLPSKSGAWRRTLIKQWKPTVDFLLKTQTAGGYWGSLHSQDQFRSPRCASLLSWWLSVVDSPSYRDEPVHNAIDAFLNFVVNKSASENYGVFQNTMVTGMVGLALVDALSFGSTF